MEFLCIGFHHPFPASALAKTNKQVRPLGRSFLDAASIKYLYSVGAVQLHAGESEKSENHSKPS